MNCVYLILCFPVIQHACIRGRYPPPNLCILLKVVVKVTLHTRSSPRPNGRMYSLETHFFQQPVYFCIAHGAPVMRPGCSGVGGNTTLAIEAWISGCSCLDSVPSSAAFRKVRLTFHCCVSNVFLYWYHRGTVYLVWVAFGRPNGRSSTRTHPPWGAWDGQRN